MASGKLTKRQVNALVDKIIKTYQDDTGINFIDSSNLPVRSKIVGILELLMEVLFPGYTGKRIVTKANLGFIVGDMLCQVSAELCEQIERAYKFRCRMEDCDSYGCEKLAEEVTAFLLKRLPHIRQMLKGDVEAAYEGDPAAKSFEEIVVSYPGLAAITTYRIAHELYVRDVPLLPRIMSEYAHSLTGIDIHPGATIGRNFFIDHGTGVVIGETTIIGDNVKLYQGTTLGALSFAHDERGKIVKSGKRHPTLEDDVTIYAEATILGDVTIGKGAVIGGNVWIRESVPAGVTVTTAHPDLLYKKNPQKKGKAK